MRRALMISICFCVAIGYLTCLSPDVFGASTRWVAGEVTKSPWKQKYDKIEVDGVTYTIMPKIKIRREFTDNKGADQKQPYSLNRLHRGMEITIRVQGTRIYEILYIDK